MSVNGIGPSAGVGSVREIYLIPSVNTTPTTTPARHKGSGVSPGLAEPATANRADGCSLGTIGSLRQDATSDPTIEVKAIDSGTAPGRGSSIATIVGTVNSILNGRGGTVTDIMREVNITLGNLPATPQRDSRLPVQRFGVKRTSYDQGDDSDFVGVTEDFIRSSQEFTPVVGGSTYSPKFVKAADGALLMVCASANAAAGTWAQAAYTMRVYRFNPSTDTAFALYGAAFDFKAAVSMRLVGLCPVLFNEDVYVVTVAALYTTDGASTDTFKMHVFRLNPTTPALELWPSSSSGGYVLPRQIGSTMSCCTSGSDVVVAMTMTDPTGTKSNIQVARSSDLRTWSADTAATAIDLVQFGNFTFDRPDELDGNIVAMSFGTSSIGFAVTDTGQILRTDDGGQGWSPQSSPVDRNHTENGLGRALYGVRAFSDTVIFACGRNGLVLKTTDGGVTWVIIRNGGSGDTVIDAAYPPTGSSNRHLYAVAVESATKIWCAGSGGWVCHYNSTSTPAWVDIVDFKSGGVYTGIERIGADAVQVVGGNTVHNVAAVTENAAIRDKKNTCILHIGSATTAKTATHADLTYFMPDCFHITGLTRSGSVSYAVDSKSNPVKVLKWDGINWGVVTYLPRPVANVYYNQVCAFTSNSGSTVWVGADERLYRSTDGGVTFPEVVSLSRATRAVAMYFSTDDLGVVASAVSVGVAIRPFDDRMSPALYYINGTTILGVQNLSRRRIEIMTENGEVLDDAGQSLGFDTLDFTEDDFGSLILAGGAGINPTSAGPTTPTAADGGAGNLAAGTYSWVITTADASDGANETAASEPVALTLTASKKADLSFTAAVAGRKTRIYRTFTSTGAYGWIADVAAATGTYTDNNAQPSPEEWPPSYADGGRVRTGDGRWLNRTDPTLPMPLGKIPITSDYTRANCRISRTTIAYMGRLFSAIIGHAASDTVGIFVAREFHSNSVTTHYVPITNRAQWLGVDAAQGVFVGQPAINDQWTIEPKYDYPARHLLIESPSAAMWRGKTEYPSIAYSATNDVVIRHTWDAGSGRVFEVTGFALFNTRFQTATFGISHPDNEALFNEWTQTVVIDSGYATNPVPNTASNIIVDADKNWVPRRFKSGGLRQFYLKQTLPDGSIMVYKILDSSETTLTIDGSVMLDVAPGIGTSYYYEIFSDRIVCIPNDLYGTTNRFGRYVRISIPASTASAAVTADGYRSIGTAIIGKYVAASYKPTGVNDKRYRFSRGFGWKPTPNTIETTALSGPSSVEHFGIGQQWTLPYEAVAGWDAWADLNGLTDQMRKAFCMIFNGEDLQSAELVRLADGSDYINVGGDKYTTSKKLVEVK